MPTAIEFVNEQISALEIVWSELTRIYTGIIDLDLAGQVRGRISGINEMLFTLQSVRNSLEAAAEPVPPPSDARLAELSAALHQLDAYVRNDQNIHMAINYLIQVGTLINNA